VLIAAEKRADDCARGLCASAGAKRSYDALKTASAVTFYSGAVFALGGLAGWFLTAPAEPTREPRVRWSVSPGGVTLSTAF
jgi:hypothetical protein